MAVAIVQSTVLALSGSSPITLTGVTAGNMIVVGFVGFDTGGFPDITSISDGTNTYAQTSGCQTHAFTNGGGDIWYTSNTVSGGNYTITPVYANAPIEGNLWAVEVSGFNTSTPFYNGANTVNTGGGVTTLSPNITTTSTGDAVIAFCYVGSEFIAIAPPFTALQPDEMYVYDGGYLVPGTTGTYQMTNSLGSPPNCYYSFGAAIKVASAPVTNKNNMFLIF